MKILCLSDLHLQESIKKYNFILSKISPDIIVITGDIYESNIHPRFVYNDLNKNLPNIPIICTLGNHEFFYNTTDYILNEYTKYYKSFSNIHYLDVIHKYDYNNIRFIGNVLWYDGSMCNVPHQNIEGFANKTWKDYTIQKFNYKKEFKKNVNNIKLNIDSDKINILCTHCVPHYLLNGHMNKINQYNAYSGSYSLLGELNVQYCICGHTHLPIETIITTKYGNCKCYNIGNDYFDTKNNFNYKLIEV